MLKFKIAKLTKVRGAMEGKKFFEYLFLKPAFTSRNLSSLFLVGAFFGIYILAGGKIEAIPNVKAGAGFGTVESSRNSVPNVSPLGAEGNTSAEAAKLENPRGESVGAHQARREVKKVPNLRVEDSEGKLSEPEDKLSELEQRLKDLKKKNSANGDHPQ